MFRDQIVSQEEFRTYQLKTDALTSGIYKMFQYLTGGVDLGASQVPPVQHRSMTEQEVLALQLQEQAARKAQASAMQQHPLPLQTNQVKTRDILDLVSNIFLVFHRLSRCRHLR